tara:strand:- start:545 stop:1876 length:1332 start_codon:yes stop_codon:yes gene_type:complete
MSNSLDIEEKINILFKNYLGFPNTNKNKEYYNEDDVVFSDYHLGEEVFLKTIPKIPNFNISKNSSYLNLNDNDFYDYNSSSILEDSSGVVIKITKLKLEIVPNSEGKSFYKLDMSGNNILTQSLLSSKNRYFENGTIKRPYQITIFSSLNKIILKGEYGGDWQMDVKSGIIYFPNLENITDHVIDKDNPPYLTFCKYIGKKGLEVLDSEIQNSLNNKAPINNPEFTGVPKGPTAELSVYNEQLATTKYVKDKFENLVNLSPGSLEALTDLSNALAQNSNLSTTIMNLIAQKEPIIETTTDLSFNKLELLNDLSGQDASFNNVSVNSLEGIPKAPTASLNTNTKQIATTEFVANAISDISNGSIKLNQDNIISLNDTLTKNINDVSVITMFGLINLETKISDLSGNHLTKITNLETELATANNKISTLETQVADLLSRVTALEN